MSTNTIVCAHCSKFGHGADDCPSRVAAISPTLLHQGDDQPRRVEYYQLNSTAAMSAIGLVAARMLLEHRIVTLMIGKDLTVEVVPAGELELDSLPEESALQALISRGYTDQQMSDYLQQRQMRYLSKVAQDAVTG